MDLLAGSSYAVDSHGVAAGYAAWLLREFGARVDHRSALDPEGLGAFLAADAEKLRGPRETIEPGVTYLTDEPVTAAARKRLEAFAASRAVIWITPWGLQSDWAERPASDLALYAASGWMSAVGEPGREPLSPPGSQCRFIAGLFAAIAALEHHSRDEEPRPGLIDVSILEALTATLIYDSVAFQYYGRLRDRVGERFSGNQPLLATLPCKDGYIGLHSPLHNQWLSLSELVGHPELVEDPRFASLVERAANIRTLDDDYLLPWLSRRTRWQVYHELQARRIPCSAHPDMGEVLDSPQLRARGSWRRTITPAGRELTVPGPVARVLAQSGPGQREERPGPWRPGALRIVDLSMGWAGPMVTLNLAAMGADVIKVESHSHFDWWRGSRPPGDGDGMGLHERSHVFNTANRGKRGITLDLGTERGREVLLDLVATADALVENYAAGVLEKLGLTYEVLSARNPSLVMLRQPGFGGTGPEAGYVVFGNTIEGMSGLSSLVGYEGGRPMMLSNAAGDPVSGLVGTVALLAALRARADDGKGRLIECAQLEGFLPLVSEGLIEHQVQGSPPARRGNRRAGAPSGAYHAGDDRWVVLEVRNDEEWARLADEIAEEWAVEPALSLAGSRIAARDDLDRRIAQWVAGAGAEAALQACLSAGVPAALVNNESDVLGLEPLLASDFWQGMDREPVGFHLHPTIAYSRAGERPLPQTPAPFLGQHTKEVLEAMGIGAAARAELARLGVTGEIPITA